MSRIGRQPIELPAGVMVALSPGRVQVNGPLGELSQQVPLRMTIEKEQDSIIVKRPTDRGDDRSLHGLTRTLIANMIAGTAAGPRRVVFRSNLGIYAQLVDDADGRTLTSVGFKNLPKSFKGTKTDQAREIGKLLADRAKKAGCETVVFDRAGYLYHGRVKALAEGAREGGLKF